MDQYFLRLLSGHRFAIPLSAYASALSIIGRPGRLFARAGLPDRLVVPWGVAALVVLGTTLVGGVVGMLRAPVLAAVLVAGIGGLVLLGWLGPRVELRRRRSASAGPHLSPSFESAFVCTKCAEYAPPPDWSALLREAGATAAIGSENLGPAGPAGAPGEIGISWVSPVAVSSLARHPLAETVHVPEIDFVPPAPRGAPALSVLSSDLLLSQGRLVSDPSDGSRFSRSGAWVPPTVVRAPRRAGSDGPSAARALPPDDAGTGVPLLDSWILTEANGLLARTQAARSTDVADEPTPVPTATASLLPRCAACRAEVPTEAAALQCPDCRRPICDPCRDRVVEHDGGAWCAPCAVNRLSAQFLSVVESDELPAPTGPFSSSVRL